MESCLTAVPPAPSTSTFHPVPLPSSSSSTSSRSGSDIGGREVSGTLSRRNSTLKNNNNNNLSIPPIPPAVPHFGGNCNGVPYQIHDGFATVRKRKGPSCASIAMRQEQECYDLAQPISRPENLFQLQQKQSNNNQAIGAQKTACLPLNPTTQAGGTGKKVIGIDRSLSHSSGLGNNADAINGRFTSKYSSVRYGKTISNPPDLPRNVVAQQQQQQQWDSMGVQQTQLCCNSTNIGLSQNRQGAPSNSNGHYESVNGGRPRIKSSSSLSRKIRRLVLPNKLFPPALSRNGAGGKMSEKEGNGMTQTTTATMMTTNTTRLRTSVSDNSLANNSSFQGGIPGDGSNPTLCQSNSQTRHFHRSCFLPKPPLETVMEDGIPWRPRKDVPWWELATKRHRYRSCPVLQATQHQAHVVAAFEQSLSNMTHRLQSLSVSAEQKDSEVMELRRTIELLRKQSIEAGLTVASLTGGGGSRDGSPIGRQLSADSVSSINSISSACSGTSHSHTSGPSGQVLMTPLGTPTHHHHHHHHGTTTSTTIPAPDSPSSKKKQSKGKGSWLRSSLKAFSRKSSKTKCISPTDQFGLEDALGKTSHLNGNCGDGNLHVNGNCHPQALQHKMRHMDDSAPGSPILTSPHSLSSATHSNGGCSSSSGSHSPRSNGHVKGSGSSSGICEDFGEENASVDDLKKQLREKEMVLTDIRLEALTSAHQLESFKETVNKMRNEMLSLKQDNERLQRLVSSKSLNSSETSLQINPVESIDRRLSASEVPGPTSMDFLLGDGCEKDGKRITVTAFLGCHGSFERYINGADEFPAAECSIGNISVGSKANWEKLDASVRAAFKEYVTRLDPVTKLGLCAESVDCYNVGEVMRARDSPLPELLPCGYIVGDVNKIRICLRGAIHNGALDALAFETLIPKSVLQRYLTLLMDHGRMILCGPSGTGKSYLARKLGEFIVARSGKTPCAEAIATFSADHKNSKELRQYLTNLAEQCESGSADLPSVIILDNLHHVSSFGEVFNGFLHSKLSNSPIVIGTMSQSNSAAAKLQVHHNFRWILFGNHMDPVKGFLNRYLQRRLIDTEVQSGMRNLELARITEWIPKVWSHVNKFLETHNSSDVTIGPRLFLSCPMDIANSQVWFTDLWHYSVVPYVVEAVKEGVQLYGKKAVWEDPTQFLRQTYPWTESHGLNAGKSALLSIRAEDVGYDKGVTVNGSKVVKQESKENDPLMNMLMRLQEAANYSGPQSNDSDTTSLDSHISLESTKDYTAPA